ncbi:30S ribosomal protein S6 modification protein [Bacteroidia bacterium]|nr:30S ribosomal protein S6 modification protein [Bacteroidia bacterium]
MDSVIILLDNISDWKPYYETNSILTVSDYLKYKDLGKESKLVINLSSDYSYNSEGYFSSLLAQARGHRVIPGVEIINKLEAGTGVRMDRNLQKTCYQWIQKNNVTDEIWYLNIYFGKCKEKGLEKVARFIFENYHCPLLKVGLNTHPRNQIETIQALSLQQLNNEEQNYFAESLDSFSKKVWRTPRSSKSSRYSIAIFYNPDEKFPPSDTKALNKFLDMAKKINIHAELITEEDAHRVLEFDALFIRATTTLNNITYKLSQVAASNNMVVIDDPLSIIRCTNKVYLCELLEREKVPIPASTLIFRSNENTFADIESKLGSPFIVKIPDGSFSHGMKKVANESELKEVLTELFEQSAILLAQEYIPTEFDWRIGVLDGEPLFACKYFMAKGHWQIYNHLNNGKSKCGDYETIPIYKVPQNVLKTALKAASFIGKGLYGVDLKVVNDKAVVIEINDNPNIDFEVEDAVLGDELYYRILNYFVRILERRK